MLRGLAVSGAHDHIFHGALHVPLVLAEIHSEVVEELGVGGQFALQPEILGGFDDAIAEELLPEAVHLHAGGEWVFRSHRPLGEAEAVFRGILRHRWESGRGGALARAVLERLVVGAAVEDIGLNGSRALFHHHYARGAVVEMVFEVVGAGEIEAGGGRLAAGVGLGGEVGVVHPILAVLVFEQRQPVVEAVRVVGDGDPEGVRQSAPVSSLGALELEFHDELGVLRQSHGGSELEEYRAIDTGDAELPAIGRIGGLRGSELGAEALEGRADGGDGEWGAFAALLQFHLNIGQRLANRRQIHPEHRTHTVGLVVPEIIERIHRIHAHGIDGCFQKSEFLCFLLWAIKTPFFCLISRQAELQGQLLAGRNREDRVGGISFRKKPVFVFRHVEIDGAQSAPSESIVILRSSQF